MTELATGIEPDGSRKPNFEHLSGPRVRAILNCLTESTFFYRDDDRDLFDYLRRQRAEFVRFFAEHFGWDLHVDRKVARLFKRQVFNDALTTKQRDRFDLTRRDECILFMLLLEFHEQMLAELNVHHEHDDDLRFELSDFVRHAIERFGRELGEQAPADRELFNSVRNLFRELVRHRFIVEVERMETDGDGVARDAAGLGDRIAGDQGERVLYEFLPGIHCYDPTQLSSRIILASYVGNAETNGTDEMLDSETENTTSGGEESP